MEEHDFNKLRFRAKANGDAVAFMLHQFHLRWMGHVHGDRSWYSFFVHVIKDSNQDITGRVIYIRKHPEGYEINFKKPDALVGELSLTYNVLKLRPPGGTWNKGALNCLRGFTRAGEPALVLDASAWTDVEQPQMGLFGDVDRLIIPGQKAIPDTDPVIRVER
jgi:hypothetical protein